ncbi:MULTISPECIES: Asp23/Gls24 family envelope stress response protein [Mycobacteriaceae]|uniref:Asp23/Gls24 family envelope stress response protein n=1 Tax=Mycobacteriaceae TaxID=1762 RepID=UPI0007FE0E74|nr:MULTISPECIES: Asp23/Gls24 family envelope stress response protein [Mycobacteriaceae]MCK0176090.1 Asp23/Gls24 family envelope stress response protein [Mycolicibacterium sp. F2034L]OBB58239.1 hypothetical protein A5757_17235 [Mycobacterium sp. 852013-51886_SCH5428379]
MAESIPVPADPGDRGGLTLRQRAVERVTVTAALDTDGVHRYGVGLAKWTGRELPRADVVVSGDHVRAAVDVAVEWGRPLAATAAETARNVTRVLGDLSGLTVDGVDVHIAAVIPPGAQPDQRRRLR